MNIAITGASGNIGGMVARHLNTRGLPLILPLRNPAKAPALPNCEAPKRPICPLARYAPLPTPISSWPGRH